MTIGALLASWGRYLCRSPLANARQQRQQEAEEPQKAAAGGAAGALDEADIALSVDAGAAEQPQPVLALATLWTRVGYCGGQRASPTYRSIGDHTEALQVCFDPQRISFERLVELFWEQHNPTQQSAKRQYWHILFYHDEEQQRTAEASRDAVQAKLQNNACVLTKLQDMRETSFTNAENYHQHYFLQQDREIMKHFNVDKDSEEFIAHPEASRLNAFVAGNARKSTYSPDLFPSLDEKGIGRLEFVIRVRKPRRR